MGLAMKYFTGIFHVCRDIRSDISHLIVAMLFFSFSTSCFSAEEPEAIILPPPTIALSNIPSQSASERAMLDQAAAVLAESTTFNQIQQKLVTENEAITQALPSLTTSLSAASSRDAITEIRRKWLELDRQMTSAESTLHARTEIIAQQIVRLQVSLNLWNRTISQAVKEKAPEDLVKLARITANDISTINSSLQKVQNQILELQGRMGRSHRGVQEALDTIKAEEADLVKNLGQRERPPLWGETVTKKGPILYLLVTQIGHDLSIWWSRIYSIVNEESIQLGLQVFLLIAAAIILYQMRKSARACIAANPSIEVGSSVFERPFALAMLLALMLTPWLYASTSSVLTDAMGLLLIFPVLWIVLPLLNEPSIGYPCDFLCHRLVTRSSRSRSLYIPYYFHC